MKILVFGNGAWGAALAAHFARIDHDVLVWSRSGSAAPDGCAALSGDILPDADIYVLATPTQTTRSILTQFKDQFVSRASCLITAKGIELSTLSLQSDIIAEVAPNLRPAILTGPSFAKDVTAGKPTALTVATADLDHANDLRDALSGEGIRVYSSDDMIGAQIGGALKNVIAIGCGIVIGRGLGASAQAALMTRGFAELARLGIAMGGDLETLSGLSGLGDLTLTCHSQTSRNFSYGYALGQTGKAPTTGTFEGAKTAQAALDLSAREGISMPITKAVAEIIADSSLMDAAIVGLLNRPLKDEAI